MLEASNGVSTSVWMATASVPVFPPLAGDIEADVCVVGAGIAGLTTAYLLGRQGRSVVVIDAIGIGAGETGRTTAHFFPPDEWYADIQAGFGEKTARLVADAYAQSITQVETIIRHERIDCEFERVSGYLYKLPENAAGNIVKEFEAAKRAGADVELLARVPGLDFDTGHCIHFRNQAQFHPLKYLAGLAGAIGRDGGRLYGGTRALGVDGDARMQTVTTSVGKVRADAVVIATNTPFNDRVVMHTKQAGYRTYVIGLRVPKDSVPRILLWDTGDPYHYIRIENGGPQDDHDFLVVGGADHKVGQDSHPQHRYDELERWTRDRFPAAGAVEYRWSGAVMEPSDGLAYLGRNPVDDSNVYVITGDSGNGMTHTTIGAMLVTDLILGRENPWQAVYAPARKVRHGVAGFVAEQANTLSKYGDWVTGGEVDSAQEIASGEGAILRDGMRKVAVYRDDEGALHAVSAKCSHLGCVVHWNSAERSWDCPCHGSRFDVEGQVLHGPAVTALPAVTLDSGNMRQAGPGDAHRGQPGDTRR